VSLFLLFFLLFFLLSLIVYVSFVVWILFGLRKLNTPQKQGASGTPTISVVIAARNEAEHIAQCLHALTLQTHAPLELIIIDDASEDETSHIVQAQPISNLRLLRNETPIGKKPSLAKGIACAKGEIIACTDADCLVPPTWLEEIATSFREESLGFLSMPVVYHNEKNLFEQCQSLDFLALVAIGGALIKLGRPAICNGANIAYRRTLFFQTGGFGKIKLASGDDEAVMRNIFKIGYNVEFLATERATVKTVPVRTLRNFFKQRIRWASKGTAYGDVSFLFLLALALIYAFNLMLLLSPLWAWLSGLWHIAFASVLIKFSVDFLAIWHITKAFHRTALRRVFLAAEFLQIVYVALTPLLAELFKLGKGYEWKGVNRK
jgi:cellulose synthase/poly-beta-1,6-N-acetylglucosamine synthase-like glycosyltransferase